MQQMTKNDIQSTMKFVTAAKKQAEQEIMDFIHKSINNFYSKTGIAISGVYVDATTAKDLNGNIMSYVTEVRCSTNSEYIVDDF